MHRSHLVLLFTLLAGCATGQYGPSQEILGLPRQTLIEQMGKPTGEWNTPQGLVLEYARGPYGKHTFLITLDGQQKVRGSSQVLTLENFDKITPGMSADAVRRLIGQSFEIDILARDRGEVWSYRFQSLFCEWFQIEFSKEGIVRSKGMGIPPECSFDDVRE
jgi:hypothetical protein